MPGIITPAGVRRHIKTGDLEPLYLFTGSDDAEMSRLAAELSDAIPEDFRAFNVQRFYGPDKGLHVATVLDAAATLPLLAPRRIVLLLQADRLLGTRRRRGAAPAEQGRDADVEEDAGEPAEAAETEETGEEDSTTNEMAVLEAYAQKPHQHATVAVFAAGLKAQFERLARHTSVVACEPDLGGLEALVAEHNVRFDRGALELLRQRAAGDPVRMMADAERVMLYAAGSRTITRDDVAQVTGRPSAAGGRQLWSEVANGHTAAALTELQLELAEGAVPFMVLGLLRSVVERKMSGAGVPAALDALLRTDLALKSSGGDPRVLLEWLVVELCDAVRGDGGR